MYIVGLNISHDPSAVLVQNSELLFASEEEKLCKRKSFYGFPKIAFEQCLDIIKSNPSNDKQIIVAVGCRNIREFLPSHLHVDKFFGSKKTGKSLKYRLRDIFKLITNFDTTKHSNSVKQHFEHLITKIIFEYLNVNQQVQFEYVDHHVSHSLSALVGSPFRDGIIVTLDGKGDGRSGSAYAFENLNTRLIDELHEFQSIGQMYSVVTEVLGFKSKRHEGKVTGLAARGNSESTIGWLRKVFGHDKTLQRNSLYFSEKIRWIRIKFFFYSIRINRRGEVSTLQSKYFAVKHFLKFCLSIRNAQIFQLGRLHYIERLKNIVNEQKISREDLACAIQEYCEQLAVDFVKRVLVKANMGERVNICLAGGVFSNVLLNQKIFEISAIDDVYVQPAMNDAGTALGAAYKVSIPLGKELRLTERNPFFGPASSYDFSQKLDSRIEILSSKIGQSEIVQISNAMYENKVIGIFRGRLEWGPRALGNRSILARADREDITTLLNQRLGRSDFMPFAPMVLEEDINFLFKSDLSSAKVAGNLMTMTFSLQPSAAKVLEGIAHIDGTARPQIIKRVNDEFYFKLLREVKSKIGYGVCINTSFNMHESPIIQDPNDAFEMLLSGAIDLLVYENTLFGMAGTTLS